MERDVRSSKRPRLMEETENTITDKFGIYDVFISHRGPDTKTGFVSFLVNDLIAAGLQPFLDCKSIDVGVDSWECIEHAIKKASIAVVIFSERFAESAWCLRELHVMLRSPGVKVIPVFYNVRPREVRFPESGQLKGGFEMLTQRYDETVIEEWRADLELASRIMGVVRTAADKGLESDLLTEVVGKILEVINKPLPLAVGDYVVGVNEVAEAIIQTLDEKKTVLMLGLWGTGGIGKSTLARELYNRLSRRFDAACFVEGLTEKVVEVQNRILGGLCGNKTENIEDKLRGKIILEERLCRKRILMVLDDVRDSEEMEYCISRKMLREGSMCMVTSRNRRVFEVNSFHLTDEVYIHAVQSLSLKESIQVLTLYAFGAYRNVKVEFEELVTNVSDACGGIPLVLKVCGAFLKNKSLEMWEEVTKKLKCGTIMNEKKIFSCLRISFDALSWEQQEMFLDIACGLIGQPRDWAVRVWRPLQRSAELGVYGLIKKALVTVDWRGKLRMHDHLRDMGRVIVKQRRAREGVIRRLWMPESLSALAEPEGLPDSLQSLILSDDDDDKFSGDTIDVDLSHMKDLRILVINSGVRVTSFPRKLRWFTRTRGCDYASREIFPILRQSNELITLGFYDSLIQSLPESFGELRKLEALNLGYCQSLRMLPDSFGGLGNLQVLELWNSGIQSLPESFGELSQLKELSVSDCKNLRMLPESFGGLSNLQKLELRNTGIQSLPESFGELRMLKELSVSDCKNLGTLPESFGCLSNLQKLELRNSGIQSLPESFGELRKLEEPELNDCKNLGMLPESFGFVSKLQKLMVMNSGIHGFPESFEEVVLDLSGNVNLCMLPDSFGGLRNLQEMKLQNSENESLPESFGKLSKLEDLNLWCCEKLIMLPNSFGSLRNLKILDLGLDWTQMSTGVIWRAKYFAGF